MEFMERNQGFTLVELMITVTVLTILITVGIPSFQSIMQNSRSAALANGLATAINLARSEAVKRNGAVTVCASSDAATCTGAWTQGWIVHNGAVIKSWEAPVNGAVIADNGDTSIQFNGSGMITNVAAVNITTRFNNCTGQQARQIRVNVSGRVSVTRAACP